MWHQGESDRSQAASYHDNLQQLVAYLRSWLVSKTGDERYATLPFIAGTVNRNSTQYNAVVEQAVLQLTEEDENFHAVDMSDCKLGSDNLHFDATGCLDAAQRMFNKLVSLGLMDEEKDDANPIPTTKETCGQTGSEVYDLCGRRILSQQLTKGIYIQASRKLIR